MGSARVAALLLAKGANVNATNDLGQTPLAMANKKGQEDVAKILASVGGR